MKHAAQPPRLQFSEDDAQRTRQELAIIFRLECAVCFHPGPGGTDLAQT